MTNFAALALWLAPLAAPCTAHGLLPDARCTPGAVATTDLRVICDTPTRDRRHVDAATKRRVLAAYGVPWADRARFEVDHLVPLELGGANLDGNLWPEPLPEARRKDAVEDRAHRDVCAGRARLEDAQRAMAEDWTRLER